jgi:hypothetical protein
VREQTFPCLSRLVGSGNIRRSLVYSSEWENSCLGTAIYHSGQIMLPHLGHYFFNAFLSGFRPLVAAKLAWPWVVWFKRGTTPATLQSFARFDKASSRLLVSASIRMERVSVITRARLYTRSRTILEPCAPG